MIASLLKVVGLNKVVLVVAAILITSLAGSGYLLKQSYEKNGRLNAELTEAIAGGHAWESAFRLREAEHIAAMARLARRDDEYKTIGKELNDYQEKLHAIVRDANNRDCGLNPAVWMLIQETARDAANSSVRSGESGTVKTD